MKTKLELFFKWGIQFMDEYVVSEKREREVKYAGREELFRKLKIANDKTRSATAKVNAGGLPYDLNQETIQRMKSHFKEGKQGEFKKSE